MRLTEVKVRNAKPAERPYKLADGGGLYLLVNPVSERNPKGSKLWRFKYRYADKEKLLALGVYPEVSLAQAREIRDRAKRLRRVDNIDPATLISRKARNREVMSRANNSFAAIAEAWYANKRQRWKDSTASKARLYLNIDLLPALGARPMREISRPDLVAALRKIEQRNAHDVAKKCRGWLSNIFRYALVEGVIETNPATDLDVVAATAPRRVQHPHLQLTELPAFLEALEAYGGAPETRYGIEMLLLTAVRPGELRGMTWSELDLPSATWQLPAERMKMGRPHTVPLPAQAMAIIEIMRPITGTSPYVFPSAYKHKQQMSDATMSQALARIGYKGRQTPHGFRHMVSTALNERGYNRDWIEKQLAHGDDDEIRGTYNKAEYLDQRRDMMQQWADTVDAMRRGSTAVRSIGKAA